jgi:hypothetical protein
VTRREPPKITDERLAKAVDQIKSGAYTTDKLRANFTLTAEQDGWVVQELAALPAGAAEPSEVATA